MIGVRLTPARIIPGRLILECEECGDGINMPNTPTGEALLNEFTSNHHCEPRKARA